MDKVLQALEEQRRALTQQLATIDAAWAAYTRGTKQSEKSVKSVKRTKKHTMSKSARKKIAKAQRARWAVIKKAEAEKKKA